MPDEPDDEDVEDRERDEEHGVRAEIPGDLIEDEEREHGDRGGISPELVLDEAPDEEGFDDAMRQEVDRAPELRARRQVRGQSRDVRRKKIVRVLDELILGQGDDQLRHARREQEHESEEDLSACADRFEYQRDDKDQADLLFRHVGHMDMRGMMVGHSPSICLKPEKS